MTTALGRLERVELRQAWSSEASDFTPWLASDENLELLGHTIGLDLEFDSQEKNVGPFRADILAKDTSNDSWVLIENQLECTNHTHLGQLLTYAAGLEANTVVWVAQKFTEQHRAAIDWLNEITDQDFSFFALEIELWRIGESPMAPKFNVVCAPNDWSRTVSAAARATERPLGDTRQLYLEYWYALKGHLEGSGSRVRIGTPQAASWLNFSIGRTHFCLVARASKTKQTGSVFLNINGDHHVEIFHTIREEKERIESEVGQTLEWDEMPERKDSQLRISFPDLDVENRDDWPRQHEMYQGALERLDACFRPRIKALDLDDLGDDEAAFGDE